MAVPLLRLRSLTDQAITAHRSAVIVTPSVGAGYKHFATELARQLGGLPVRVICPLKLAGRSGEHRQQTCRFLLSRLPWVDDSAVHLWTCFRGRWERLVAARSGAVEAALREVITCLHSAVVMSNCNLVSQALGPRVARGEIAARVVTLVTDPGAHPYWVSPDGPNARWTPRLLNALAAPRVRAKILVLGEQVLGLADPVVWTVHEGHKAAVHGSRYSAAPAAQPARRPLAASVVANLLVRDTETGTGDRHRLRRHAQIVPGWLDIAPAVRRVTPTVYHHRLAGRLDPLCP